MTVWVALLRGVNVGGRNKLPMAEFRALLADFGFNDVATYIQSGTAVFSSDASRQEISDEIASGVDGRFGFRPDVILRTLSKFRSAVTQNPFEQAQADPKTLHLFFLAASAGHFDAESLATFATNDEEFKLSDKIFYLYTPNGFGRSKVAEKMARHFDIALTGRNLRSCLKILALAEAIN
ncbi:MAG: DUF1697 domain-containing protein [Paracoccaceae bacterium]